MRWLVGLVALVALVGCSSDGAERVDAPVSTTTTVVTAGLPADLVAFVERAEPAAFTGTYHVLQKLGGLETDLHVASDGRSTRITYGDLVFVLGPKPATCSTKAQRCVGTVRDQLLSPTGVFTTFSSDGPTRQLATDGRRVQAGDPVFTDATAAGVDLRCAAVPLRGSVASTYCLTAEGVWGWVDTPGVHYELTEYRPGRPDGPTGVPYAITGDGSFLPG
jgi:hypothetical protein